MLRHFVFIKYTQGTSDPHIDEFIRMTRALPASIPNLRDLEVGRDVLHGARSWDVMLAMRFDSLEELREYQVHPAHRALMAFNDPQVAEVGSVDFLE
ncbi:MAG TPA: Dabb family protein [Steroidobacteraceae bacterium]|nr:Dabb family protein [Steroidobacteraceae bacterium]